MEIIDLKNHDIEIYHDKMVDLLQQSFKQSFPNKTIEIQEFDNRLKKLKEYLAEGKTKVFSVIEEDSLCGFIWFFIKDSNTIHINHFSINKDARGNGIGRKLIEAVEKFAFENQIDEIELLVTMSNDEAIGFYKKNNFKTERLVMKKRLIK